MAKIGTIDGPGCKLYKDQVLSGTLTSNSQILKKVYCIIESENLVYGTMDRNFQISKKVGKGRSN